MEKKLFLSLFMLIFLTNSNAQSRYVASEEEADFHGYDLVSYHQDNGPVKGKPEYKSTYDGLTLYFSTDSNKSLFEKEPEYYMPAYGGYCATAISNGNLVTPDFENFSIQNEQLLLFEVRAFFNGKTQWMKDPERHKNKADKNYSDVLSTDEK